MLVWPTIYEVQAGNEVGIPYCSNARGQQSAHAIPPLPPSPKRNGRIMRSLGWEGWVWTKLS